MFVLRWEFAAYLCQLPHQDSEFLCLGLAQIAAPLRSRFFDFGRRERKELADTACGEEACHRVTTEPLNLLAVSTLVVEG
jgi:hypothetical protein